MLDTGGSLAILAVLLIVAVPLLAVLRVTVAYLISCRLNIATLTSRVAGKHIIVSGTSKGLGYCFALRLARSGANVTMISRGTGLEEAAASIRAAAPNSVIRTIAVDLTDYEATHEKLAKLIAEERKADWLIANAGGSQPDFVANQLEANNNPIATVMQTNYSTASNLIRSVFSIAKELVPQNSDLRNTSESDNPMVDETSSISGFYPSEVALLPSKIIFVGSTVSFISFAGYSAYSASKYAVRGLADGLRNELLPLSIDVHFTHPGNMNTPGYQVELQTKPSITKKIDGPVAAAPPEDVADTLLAGIVAGRYAPTNDLLSEYIRILNNSFCPRPNPVSEWIGMGVLAAVLNAVVMMADMDILADAKKRKVGGSWASS
ncbi:3-dehydrosphinganine reductase [Entophlyctis sp. JEL0112]|nr:3-dehydrosphinganine reductase [Entophlyctis sp. JEL0112]